MPHYISSNYFFEFQLVKTYKHITIILMQDLRNAIFEE